MSLIAVLKLILTLDCRHNMSLVSEQLDRPLQRHERIAMRLHLMICRPCRRVRRQLLFLRQQMQVWLREQADLGNGTSALSDAARECLRDAVRAAAEDSSDGLGDAPH